MCRERHQDLCPTLTKDPASTRAVGRPERRVSPAALSQVLFIFQIHSQVTAEPSRLPKPPRSVLGKQRCRKPRSQPPSPLARRQAPPSHAPLPRRVSQGVNNSAIRHGQQDHREQPKKHILETHTLIVSTAPRSLSPNPLHPLPPTETRLPKVTV